MSETPTDPANAVTPAAMSPKTRAMRLRRWTIRGMVAFAIVLGIWLILAYVILPMLWRHYEHNPALADAPKTTLTSQRIPQLVRRASSVMNSGSGIGEYR